MRSNPATRVARSARTALRGAVRPVLEALESRRLLHGGHEPGAGLAGQYFDNADFTSPKLTRVEAVNFNWGAGSPAASIEVDSFSARWTGQVLPLSTEIHTFNVQADDGVRLWVGGKLLIDRWTGGGGLKANNFASIDLTVGEKYDLRLEYREAGGSAGVKLSWSTPTIGWTPVPAEHLLASSTGGTPAADLGTTLRIDSGGTTPYTDTLGRLWSADAGSSGGSGSTAAYAVENTDDDALYYTRRSGAFKYSLAVDDGNYTLKLHFADPLYTAAGQRKFNVLAEGNTVLGSFDIAANGGGKAAIVRSFPVTVADGKLDLAFVKVLNSASLSGIELVPTSEPTPGPTTAPPPPSGLDAVALSGTQIRLDWTDNSGSETSFAVERAAGGSGSFSAIGSVGTNVTTFTDNNLSPGAAYAYRVRAVNAVGPSAPSNTDSATTATVPATGFTRITWSTRAASPINRAEAQGGVIDGKLYVLGGFSGSSGPVVRSDVYDPATNTWTKLADMPRRLTHAGVALDSRNIYLAGGYIGTGPGYAQKFGTREVWKYNVDTNAYTALPLLPAERAGGGLVIVGRQLHYFSGNNASRNDVADHYVLNLDGGTTWTTSAPLPNARSHMGYVNFGGKIYALGGQKGNDGALTTQSAVHVWDPAAPGVWTEAAPMPKALSHISGSTFVVGNRILIAGGETAHGSAVRDVWAFDPAANTWTSLSPLPSARFSGVAGVIGNDLYFTGGSLSTTTWRGVVGA